MNNEESPSTPPTPEPTPAQPPVNPTPEWVPQTQYNAAVVNAEKEHVAEIKKNGRSRIFYILLSISGLLLFVLYIGMFVWPYEFISKGNCVTGFSDIAFWLNPVGYGLLLATGIVGATIKRAAIKTLGIIFIVVSPIAWFVTGIAIVIPFLCGV